LTAFLLLALAAVTWNVMREEPLRTPQEARLKLGLVLADLGLSLDQVVLSGHRFTADTAIFEAIGGETSPLAFDAAQARRRIEQLPWIEHASVVRRLPGTILVEVRERRPFAIWRRGDRQFLIDAGGRVLAPTDGHGFADLPRFAGEGAASEAQRLTSSLLAVPEIGRRLALAERVGERRWRLRLASGLVIELPERGMDAALERLDRLQAKAGVLDADLVVIDLRLPDRIALRGKPGSNPRLGPRLSSL
jgi:cell division protein FtsQ